ncbi:MAG TPA: T9SS type A sorting domain-containing protein, partial [Bacteroidia bacterium]|nr:T9SS type A sorting domain-containing protein [Bacteroidia bacterium]
LYPNPANDYIMIDSSQSGTIEVYDALGVKLPVDGASIKNGKIITNNWKEGVYFIRQISDAGIKTEKVVIQHY